MDRTNWKFGKTHIKILMGAAAFDIDWLRWGIETLCSHLKRRGYRFEDTHMTKGARISCV